MNQVHFEVFVRRGKAGGWSLQEAVMDRKEAIRKAQQSLGQNGVTSVKVTKEMYKEEDGTFQGVTVYEDGQKVKEEKKEDKPTIPCFKPQDLYSRHSRIVIARVLKPTLEEWQLTPMELIHRADMLEKLEAASTVLQHAVQQVAVAQTADAPQHLHDVFRQLMDLALRAMDRVVKDDLKGRFKKLPDGSVAKFWRENGGAGDASYLLAVAIALHIENDKRWRAKLRSLLTLFADLPEEEAAKATCIETLDAYVAEMLRGAQPLQEILGECADLGEALRLLTNIFLGKESNETDESAVHLNRLTRSLATGMLDESKGALIERILIEIRSHNRFHPQSFEQELGTMRHLAQRLVMGVGPYVTIDEITEVFAVRSKRLVTPEAIEAYLAGTDSCDDKIEKLIELEENVVGAQSKKAVAGFLTPILAAPKTELQIGGDAKPVTARLRRIAEIQANIKTTHFDDSDKRDILKQLDLLAMRVAERASFFRQIEQRAISTAEKVLVLLRLLSSNIIPEGECDSRARFLVQSLVRKSDFMATLTPMDLPASERQSRLAEFKTLYESAGLNPKDEEPAPPLLAEGAA